MRLVTVPLDQSVGGVLVHNVADAQGHKALPKGHKLTAGDIEKLRAIGKNEVYVAFVEPDDVPENEAVARIARAVTGENLQILSAGSGRVNLLASVPGIWELNSEALRRLNSLDGVTIATIPHFTATEPKKMVATYKTIGLALPERTCQAVEAIAAECGPVGWVRPAREAKVALVLTGSEEAETRVRQGLTQPLMERVQEFGSRVISQEYVQEDAAAIAAGIERALKQGADCVILAGETSIMDIDDVTPRGIRAAGGVIELYGAPVEPGNLLMLAYAGSVPIVGAPGCVKSRDTNVVDLILPRLLSGERVSRSDVIDLAAGGLLI